MKLKYVAVASLAIISLLNVPIGFLHGDIPVGLARMITALGLLGPATAFAIVREFPWSLAAAEAIATANLVGAVVALVTGEEGAVIGFALSLTAVAGATALLLGRRPTTAVRVS